MTRHRLIAILILIFLATSQLSIAASVKGTSYYKYAIEAITEGELKLALSYFHKAERAGMKSAALIYNIGVNYYKLGYYQSSYFAFYKLYKRNELTDVAQYNLALASEKMGDTILARKWLQSCIKNTSNTKLKNLAVQMLRKISPAPNPRSASKIYLSLDSLYGYDSNVTLQSATEQTQEGQDNYTQYSAVGSYTYRMKRSEWNASVRSYFRNYNQESDFDFLNMGSTLNYSRRFSGYKVVLGGGFERHTLGSIDFEELYNMNLSIFRERAKVRYGITYKQTNIESTVEQFSYLAGNLTTLRLQIDKKNKQHRYGVFYQNEINDREDLEIGPIFHSSSPTRHIAAGYYGYDFKKLSFSFLANYNRSSYRGVDVDISPERSGQREETQIGLSNNIAYKYNKNWKIYIQLTYTKNDSSLSPFIYNRNGLSTGLSWKMR